MRLDRLEKIVVSAMKQSERLWKPEIFEPILFEKFLNLPLENNRYFGHCESHLSKNPLSEIYKKDQPGLILIGPEGDFSPNEIEIALLSEYMPISLGEARLRTETAALASCFEVNYLNR